MARIPAAKAGTVAKLFDFRCKECEHTFEALAKRSEIEGGEIKCPKCEGATEQLLTIGCIDSHAAASWRR